MKQEKICHAIFQSPIGKLYLISGDKGLSQVSYSKPAGFKKSAQDTPLIQQVKKQLGEYFAGKRKSWDIPLDWGEDNGKGNSKGFYLKARKAVYRVGYGKTISYKALAEKANSPRAMRAVGSAMANNPLAIIVPCHRVVKSSGATGRYGGGDSTKKWLLEMESGKSV